MMVNEDRLGRRNWVTELKELPFVNGFGYIWNNQNAREINAFILSFERRLKDIYIQNWFENISNSHKLVHYKQYKISYSPAKYLDVLFIRKHRYIVSSFRCSCHSLETERGRHAKEYNRTEYNRILLFNQSLAISGIHNNETE